MQTLQITAKTSATQRGRWNAGDGVAWAAVTRQGVRDGRGAMGWSYELSGPTERENISFHHTFCADAELIYAPGNEDDPREVLETLASFLSAWVEAQRYPASDNRDIFPMRFLAWAESYAEEMTLDVMLPEDDES